MLLSLRTGVTEQIPGASDLGAAFQDHIAQCRVALMDPVRRTDAGNSSTDDDDVDVLGCGHRRLSRSRCGARHSTI